MSLKNFHLLFITCAVALCFFVAVWAVRESDVRGNAMFVAAGIAVAGGLALVQYERMFLRRWREAGLR